MAASGWPEIILLDVMILKSELTHRCDYAQKKKKNISKSDVSSIGERGFYECGAEL